MKLLYPIALLYGLITWIRNLFFEFKIFKERSFNIPILSIGNLCLGGSGKTPHIEYFIQHFNKNHPIAVISRGYGRKTKGFRYVNTNDLAEDCGDEPLQIKRKFENILIAVCEKRVFAIDKILLEHPKINLILLDDAFQHRFVKPKRSLLLTEYSKPFWHDDMVPAGRLREFRLGWKRADAIIITKCPEKIELNIPKNIGTKPIFYSRIDYQKPISINGAILQKVIVITGIADAHPFLTHLKNENFEIRFHFNYTDHHNFTASDKINILKKIKEEPDCMLITTEKDWMRLKPLFLNEWPNLAYIPISVSIENGPKDWLNF